MLTLNKLEKVIELEEKLKAEYQGQLDARAAEIEALKKRETELQAAIDARQATIDKQLETITDLSSKASVNQRAEQLTRELSNRSDKLQDEVSQLKKRVRTLQKELAEAKDELKELKQFDPPRMKKNLDASKKKLAEKTRANEVLQQSLGKTKSENAELQRRVKELEARVAELEPEPEPEAREEEAAA